MHEKLLLPSEPQGFASWEWLSAFRNTPILKIGYLGALITPLIASAINYINHYIELINSRLPATEPHFAFIELPWTLFIIFTGSLTLALGHLLNELRCPYIIKTYGSLDEYRTAVAIYIKNHATISNAVSSSTHTNLKAALKKRFADDLGNAAYDILAQAVAEELQDHKEQNNQQNPPSTNEPLDAYYERWKKETNSKRATRYIIVTCYSAALTMSLIILLKQIYTIFNSITPNLT